jgi:hypothetical protein
MFRFEVAFFLVLKLSTSIGCSALLSSEELFIILLCVHIQYVT